MLLLSIPHHDLPFFRRQPIEVEDFCVYLAVGGLDLVSEFTAGALVLVEVVLPLVLLHQGEFDLLFLQLCREGGEVQLIEGLKGCCHLHTL